MWDNHVTVWLLLQTTLTNQPTTWNDADGVRFHRAVCTLQTSGCTRVYYIDVVQRSSLWTKTIIEIKTVNQRIVYLKPGKAGGSMRFQVQLWPRLRCDINRKLLLTTTCWAKNCKSLLNAYLSSWLPLPTVELNIAVHCIPLMWLTEGLSNHLFEVFFEGDPISKPYLWFFSQTDMK